MAEAGGDGSGRKFKYNEPTKTVRVPVSKIIEIKNYLNEVEKQRFNEVASITLIDATTQMRIPLAFRESRCWFPFASSGLHRQKH